MPAAYDKYNYESYWKDREYEHLCEVIAIKDLLEKIPKINTILDIGAGYGRLTPYYLHRAKKIILTDPSAKHLKIARSAFSSKKFKFMHSKVENLNKYVHKESIDLVLLFRVLHHIVSFDDLLLTVSRMLTNKGYFLFEFPNKRHFKAIVRQFFKGDFTFVLDIFLITEVMLLYKETQKQTSFYQLPPR